MKILELTNATKAPYSFAEIETTKEDIKMTKGILKNVDKHLAEFVSLKMRPNSVSFINKNRRSLRIIFYDVNKLISQNNLFVVIFYANKRPDIPEVQNRDFFETDWTIAMNLIGNPNLLCYASQELKDGNWFNIVLFNKESDKGDVLKNDLHTYAAYTLAPKRFKWIRLHNAYLPNGAVNYNDITLEKTSYYYFDDNWYAKRWYGK